MASRRKESMDEEYWESSQAQSIGRNFNMFDDEVKVDDAKQLLKKINFDDEDDGDVVGWDGTPVPNTNTNTHLDVMTGSARYKPTGTPPSSLSKGTGGGMNVPVRPMSGRPLFTAESGGPVTTIKSPQSPEQSISDVVGGPQVTARQPTHTQVAKLETQVNFLKRELNASKKDRFASVPPRTMILRMINGEPYSLECYKSKEEKQQLLDEAIKLHDGNAIIAAVLFLRDSIKNEIFQRELYARPVATEHYLNYLKQRYDYEKLEDMLAYFGRNEEAAMIKYKQAVSVTAPETKIRGLQTCGRTHFNMDAQLSHEASMIQQQVAILERQLPVEKADAVEAQKGVALFREHPRQSIVGRPVIATLYYSCFYHYHLGENSLASPKAIRAAHKLTDKQFVWVVVTARTKLKQWKDIEELFLTKGWLGGTKMKPIVPFDRLVHLLRKLDAPREIMDKYCNLISDSRRRLEIGQKLSCHGSVIETYVHMKDRQGLIAYQSRLKSNSQEWFFAGEMLRNSSNKWKN